MTERVTANPDIREREAYAESFLYWLTAKTTPELLRPTPFFGKVSGAATLALKEEGEFLRVKNQGGTVQICTLENWQAPYSQGCF